MYTAAQTVSGGCLVRHEGGFAGGDPSTPPSLSRTDSLSLWYRVTLGSVLNNAPDLTARQLAVMMSVYLEAGPHTVRSLAKKLNVTKAVITRAANRLCKLNYIQRAPDHRDKRSIILTRTPNGIHYLRDFADIIQTEFPLKLS